MPDRPDPVQTARAVVLERFPDARAAWLGGSVARGTPSPTSDLDITVLLPGPPAPYRDTLTVQGWPVGLFVQTDESLTHYRATDAARRQPTMLRLVGESIVLVDTDGSGARLQADCLAQIAAGPQPLTETELLTARYEITDLLGDLTGAADPDERTVVAQLLWTELAQLLLAGAGRWIGTGKALLREVRGYDAETGSTYAPALLTAVRQAPDDPSSLSALADQILAPYGGRHHDGFRLAGSSG
jgi:nucleotidyltransferase-like protein